MVSDYYRNNLVHIHRKQDLPDVMRLEDSQHGQRNELARIMWSHSFTAEKHGRHHTSVRLEAARCGIPKASMKFDRYIKLRIGITTAMCLRGCEGLW